MGSPLASKAWYFAALRHWRQLQRPSYTLASQRPGSGCGSDVKSGL
jgi:hypothetical protein